MGEFSIWHWLVVGLVIMLLFGGGKVSGMMGDLAKGIRDFKRNMADEPQAPRASRTAADGVIAAPEPGASDTPVRDVAASHETIAAH